MPTLTCYRGEKKDRWGHPTLRLCDGLTVRDPLPPGPTPKPKPGEIRQAIVSRVWGAIKDEINREGGLPKKKVQAFAQTLRASGKVYAIATAATEEGAYKDDFNYVIEIPNARAFLWGANLTLGKEVDWIINPAGADADYIVLDADSFEEATVFAFGHKTETREVTFFTDIPANWIKTVNEIPASEWEKKKKSEFTPDERKLMGKLVRPPFKWVP
ncbi:hypothetical protein [Streptomyces sp. CBMA152]|uniref:hypothetical protein n=1 Tax=Streptomyces sp. CBMA152 TaxID=1896312 RepID=UPI0016604A53|nr:hypothetical protein [Streptomyces sp. CBMA152]